MTAINWTNITDLGQVPNAANTVTDGGFWVAMLFMVWIILLILNINWGLEVALLVSSFVSLIAGIILAYAQLIAWEWNLVFVAVILFTFLYTVYNKR